MKSIYLINNNIQQYLTIPNIVPLTYNRLMNLSNTLIWLDTRPNEILLKFLTATLRAYCDNPNERCSVISILSANIHIAEKYNISICEFKESILDYPIPAHNEYYINALINFINNLMLLYKKIIKFIRDKLKYVVRKNNDDKYVLISTEND